MILRLTQIIFYLFNLHPFFPLQIRLKQSQCHKPPEIPQKVKTHLQRIHLRRYIQIHINPFNNTAHHVKFLY